MVLGSGNIGSVVARDSAENLPSAEIVITDVDKKRAQEAASKAGFDNVSWMEADATNVSELSSRLKGFDVAIGALPGGLGYKACKASIAAKVDMVDVSYMPEDIMKLGDVASKAGVTIIPDCGMSPGLSSMLVGRGVSKLDRVDEVVIMNAGLPERPVPPLGYVITWSVKDLMDMYSRKVSIVRRGKIMQVEALSGLEEIEFPGVGKLEAFYTDGLRTLLYTVKAKEMWEKTLRYPGHVNGIALLKALGFFDSETVEISGKKIAPRDLTAKLFEKKMRRPDILDIVIMLIKVNGTKDGKKIEHVYSLLDNYDKERQVTSMARTTAYTASVVGQMLVREMIKETGVIPPEKLGMNGNLFKKLADEMRKKKVFVQEKRTLA